MRYLWLALVLPACDLGTPATATVASLRDLPSLAIDVEVSASPDGGSRSGVRIVVGFDSNYAKLHDACPIVRSDLVAMFDQTPIPITSVGDAQVNVEEDGSAEYEYCDVPEFWAELALGTSGAHHVVLPGGIAMEFDDGQLVQRSATPVSGNWALNAGRSFTMTWSPATDLDLPRGAIKSGFTRQVVQSSRDLVPFQAAAGSDTITLSVPADPTATGSGLVTIELPPITGSAVTCIGATRCTYSVDRSFRHAATLAPITARAFKRAP